MVFFHSHDDKICAKIRFFDDNLYKFVKRMKQHLGWIWSMYRDGFRSMTVGRSLWIVIVIKLAVMFLVIRLFFMPDTLATECADDEERAGVVRSSLSLPSSGESSE